MHRCPFQLSLIVRAPLSRPVKEDDQGVSPRCIIIRRQLPVVQGIIIGDKLLEFKQRRLSLQMARILQDEEYVYNRSSREVGDGLIHDVKVLNSELVSCEGCLY